MTTELYFPLRVGKVTKDNTVQVILEEVAVLTTSWHSKALVIRSICIL